MLGSRASEKTGLRRLLPLGCPCGIPPGTVIPPRHGHPTTAWYPHRHGTKRSCRAGQPPSVAQGSHGTGQHSALRCNAVHCRAAICVRLRWPGVPPQWDRYCVPPCVVVNIRR